MELRAATGELVGYVIISGGLSTDDVGSVNQNAATMETNVSNRLTTSFQLKYFNVVA